VEGVGEGRGHRHTHRHTAQYLYHVIYTRNICQYLSKRRDADPLMSSMTLPGLDFIVNCSEIVS
jgi:hypothetical protein